VQLWERDTETRLFLPAQAQGADLHDLDQHVLVLVALQSNTKERNRIRTSVQYVQKMLPL
jgi:hypothetical protein